MEAKWDRSGGPTRLWTCFWIPPYCGTQHAPGWIGCDVEPEATQRTYCVCASTSYQITATLQCPAVRNGTRQEERPAYSACRCPLLTRPGTKIVLVRAAAKLLTLEVACRVKTPWSTPLTPRPGAPQERSQSPRIESYRNPLTASSSGLDLAGRVEFRHYTWRAGKSSVVQLTGHTTPHNAKWRVAVECSIQTSVKRRRLCQGEKVG